MNTRLEMVAIAVNILFCLFTLCKAVDYMEISIQMTELKNEMKNQAETFNNQLKVLREDNVKLKVSVNGLESENIALSESFRKFEEKCAAQTVTRKRFPSENDKFIYKRLTLMNPGNVAFHANINGGISLNDNEVVKFDNVKTNLGTAYDGNLGVFESPTSGYYVFFVHFLVYAHKSLEAQIVKNGGHIQHIFAGTDDIGNGAGSNLAIILLNKGDRVWIKVHDKYHHGSGNILDGPWCTFAGFLLYPME